MQTTGYLLIDGKKIKVLMRTKKIQGDKFCHYVLFKLRKTGKDGYFFKDESDYLADNPEKVKKLKGGETIMC